MISKHNSHVLDKKTRNTNYPYNEIISKPNYSTDNYLFNLIDCTRKFTNEQVSGLKYEGKYFMSDNFKHRPRENEKNRQKKCYHNNFNYMKDNRNYIYTRSKNIFNESEKERPRQNLFNKYPYVYESIEKTNTKNSNNISSENQFITSYIRPDQMPIHKLLKITEPSLEAMEAMNHVLNGNMFYVKKQLR